MGLVAVTVLCATLGVYVARDWGGAGWFVAWLLSFGCLIGLNVANARGNTGLALALLLALRAADGRERRHHGQLLRGDRPDGRPSGVRRHRAVRRRPRRRRLRDPARPLVPVPDRVLAAARAAGRRDRADLRPDPGRVHAVLASSAWRVFGLYVVIDFNRLRRAGQPGGDPARRRHLPRRAQHLPVLPADLRPPLMSARALAT